MIRIAISILSAIGLTADVSAQTVEEAAVRSSHPRGFASDGRPPQPTSARRASLPTNTTVRQNTSTANTAHSPTQVGREGVNISGSTRIDARSSDAAAAAIGQKNTAGNRVGVIGGKQD